MAGVSNKIGSYILTGGTFTFSTDNGVKYIALTYISGTVTYQGSASLPQLVGPSFGLSSVAITLTAANGLKIGSENPIDGLIVDATAGSVQIDTLQ